MQFLGRDALGAQRPIVIKLSRGRSVGPSVGLSSVLWKNGERDPDAVWHHRSDGSRDEAGSEVWGSVYGKGYFLGRIWGAPVTIVTNGDFTAYVCDSAAALFPIYFGQTCYTVVVRGRSYALAKKYTGAINTSPVRRNLLHKRRVVLFIALSR